MADKKRTDVLDWQDVRYFAALAEHGSLSAAARALRVNHATVARRVAALEETLGRVLVERRADGYVLTAEGRLAQEAAVAMATAATGLDGLTAGEGLSGSVRLTAVRVLTDAFLAERLVELRFRHPELAVEMIAENRSMSLARAEVDIALRLDRPDRGDLVRRHVATIGFGFYATPEWRDRLVAGEAPDWVGFDEDSDFVREAAWLARAVPDARFAFRSNSQAAQAVAVRKGVGIGVLPHYLAARDPGLVAVSLGLDTPSSELWLLMRPDRARVPRIRAVADYVADVFRDARGLLAG